MSMWMAMADVPWMIGAIVVPLAAAVLALLGGRHGGPPLGALAAGGIVMTVIGMSFQVGRHGPMRYPLGSWGAPLGIELHADGLSALMLLMTAGVGVFINIYAVGYFADRAAGSTPKESKAEKSPIAHGQEREYFWPLWLFLWGTLNALFLSADVFNLYVTLELLTLSAVALVALAGAPDALTAALRYLLAALLGSLAYLLGVALLYAAYGTLDVTTLGQRMSPGGLSTAAVTLITLGLLLKTALFPLHFWLPAAHANAPAPVSAVLSSLVVTASFYLLLRLWFEAFPAALSPAAGQLLGCLGAAAMIWGSLQAFFAQRLKLLVAYSTVAQLGYFFLLFPLAGMGTGGLTAWSGGVFFAVSHAGAKAALFLAAGSVLFTVGHDRIAELEEAGQRLPMTFLTMGLAAVTLMGLPPSGAFVAKWLLIDSAVRTGQAWWGAVLILGGLLSAGYLFRVLRLPFTPASDRPVSAVPRGMAWSALLLALAALLLGFWATPALRLARVGAPLADSPAREAGP
ncbi:MAG: complex I subunit 5 family protein [Gemmataceae bacterium]